MAKPRRDTQEITLTSLILSSAALAESGEISHRHDPTTIEDRLNFLHERYGPFIAPGRTNIVWYHNLWGNGTPEIPLTSRQVDTPPALFGALQPVNWDNSHGGFSTLNNTDYHYPPPTLDLRIIGFVTPNTQILGKGGIYLVDETAFKRNRDIATYLLENVCNILVNTAKLEYGLIINDGLARTLRVGSSSSTPFHPGDCYGVVAPKSTYTHLQNFESLTTHQQNQARSLFLPPVSSPHR